MQRAAYKIGIFIQLLLLFVDIQCQCPEFFRYFRNETDGEIIGIVEIPKPPQNVPLHLCVILSVATVLPTEYVGRIELTKSREDSIRAVLQGLSLFYRIYFPMRYPIPVVVRISLNDVPYCAGQPAMGVIVTSIKLEHTLWYPPYIPLTKELLDFISNHTNSSAINENLFLPAITTPVPEVMETRPTSTPGKFHFNHPFKHRVIDDACGLMSETTNIPLMTSSDSTPPIRWPWLTAIYFMKDDLEFQCTGNLISKQHVLTVAHCLLDGGRNVPINILFVSLGRFNLQNWNEPGSYNSAVLYYTFHPGFKNTPTGDSDLALLKLANPVEFTSRIRPVCLWMDKIELEKIVGQSGYVIGWGSNGSIRHVAPELSISKVPIVSQEDCLRSNVAFIDITSNRTFCAGKRDGSGPCNGDSGSGFVMHHKPSNRYHLRGIVALSIMDVRTRFCDRREYFVYVDIAKYLQWIHQEMNT